MNLDRLFASVDAHIEERRSVEGIFNAYNIKHLYHHLTENLFRMAKAELRRKGRLSIDRLNELFLLEVQRRPLQPLDELCAGAVECPYRYDPSADRIGSCPCGEDGCFIDSSELFDDTAVADCGRLVELRFFPDVEWVLAVETENNRTP